MTHAPLTYELRTFTTAFWVYGLVTVAAHGLGFAADRLPRSAVTHSTCPHRTCYCCPRCHTRPHLRLRLRLHICMPALLVRTYVTFSVAGKVRRIFGSFGLVTVGFTPRLRLRVVTLTTRCVLRVAAILCRYTFGYRIRTPHRFTPFVRHLPSYYHRTL